MPDWPPDGLIPTSRRVGHHDSFGGLAHDVTLAQMSEGAPGTLWHPAICPQVVPLYEEVHHAGKHHSPVLEASALRSVPVPPGCAPLLLTFPLGSEEASHPS